MHSYDTNIVDKTLEIRHTCANGKNKQANLVIETEQFEASLHLVYSVYISYNDSL